MTIRLCLVEEGNPCNCTYSAPQQFPLLEHSDGVREPSEFRYPGDASSRFKARQTSGHLGSLPDRKLMHPFQNQ